MRPVSYELEKKNYTTLKPGGKGMEKKRQVNGFSAWLETNGSDRFRLMCADDAGC